VWLTLPFYDFCGFRSVAVNSVYKLQFLHLYPIVVAQHALTLRLIGKRSRSHSYKNRHGCMVASDGCCYGRVLLLQVWVCMLIRLPMFS